MSTYPGQPAPAAPKKAKPLTFIAIACFVMGAVAVGFFVVRIVQTAPRSPQPIENGVVHLKKEGLTVYASVPVLSPPCEATDSNGNDVPLKKPSGSETITINDDTWYVIAKSVETVPAGDYIISCTDDETSATYAAGPKSSVGGFVVSIFGVVLSFIFFIGLGVVLLSIALLRTFGNNSRPAETFPGTPGAPRPGTYYPPPPTHTFPAPPPYNPGPNPDRPQDLPHDRPQDR